MVSSASHHHMQRVAEYRRESQGRIGQHSARQYLGPGSKTIEAGGTIYSARRKAGRPTSRDTRGSPLRLVQGTGARGTQVNGGRCGTRPSRSQLGSRNRAT